LAWKIAQSPLVKKIYAAPGNPGLAQVAECRPLPACHLEEIRDLALAERIDLTVIGPDDCLAAGMADLLQAAGLKVFGPSRAAARIESSKAFAKELMAEERIPAARSAVFTDFQRACDYVKSHPLPTVIKASGLALGKGAIICHSNDHAFQTLHSMMVDKLFGQAGETVVIEEFLEGREVSVHAFCDGANVVLFPPAQDHKAVHDGDQGPNTGGMGCFCPVPWVTREMLAEIKHRIVEPVLHALAKRGTPFRGCLYPGLMLTNEGFKVLEFNARFGDPEAQSFMPLLESDLVEAMLACTDGTLGRTEVKWSRRASACVIAASEGYPGAYRKGLAIDGLEAAERVPGVTVFQAGTAVKQGNLVTAGGRVLGVTGCAETLDKALEAAYRAMSLVSFEGMHYRRDIGRR
jgi:phosphoribosylamine--glycine ligase